MSNTAIRLSIAGRVREIPVFGKGRRKKTKKDRIDKYGFDPFETENESTEEPKSRYEKGVKMKRAKRRELMNICYYLYHKRSNKKGRSRFLFYTFTVPPFLDGRPYDPEKDDPVFSKLFSKCLKNVRQNYGLRTYIWVAERQMKNDRKAIHWHCVFELKRRHFLDVQQLNLYWLWLCASAGCKFSVDDCYQKLQDYPTHRVTFENYRKTGDYKALKKLIPYPFKVSKESPVYRSKVLLSPVDARKVRSLEGLAHYVSKYITKNECAFHCRTNAVTRDLSRLNLEIEISIEQLRELEAIEYGRYEYDLEIGKEEYKLFTMVLDSDKFGFQYQDQIRQILSQNSANAHVPN